MLNQRQYSLYSLAADQAIAGRGVMFATYPVVADRLARGVLMQLTPFGGRWKARHGATTRKKEVGDPCG